MSLFSCLYGYKVFVSFLCVISSFLFLVPIGDRKVISSAFSLPLVPRRRQGVSSVLFLAPNGDRKVVSNAFAPGARGDRVLFRSGIGTLD